MTITEAELLGLTERALDRLEADNERLRLALEEIIQAADLDAPVFRVHSGAWVVISQQLIDRARAALDEPHEFRQSGQSAIG